MEIVASVGTKMSLQSTTKSIKMSSYAHNNFSGDNSDNFIIQKTMNIEKLLNENLETFFPWSDDENPPLDSNKTFLQKEKEIDEFFEGWRASM